MIEIILDEPNKIFHPSENVSGYVKVTVQDTPKKVKSLDFYCKGEAHTSWDRYEGKCNIKRENRWIIPYEGREEYFRIEKNLIGAKGSPVELQLGEHIYPFSFVLPPNIPSSFEDIKGYVRYSIKAILVRPWKINYQIRKLIKVVRDLDLNVIEKLREPVNININKSFCCLWCKSGPLNMIVSLPYTGYTPGQTITLICDVDNGSDIDIEEVIITLKQLVFYHSTNPWRETWSRQNRILTKSHVQVIGAKHQERFIETIVVPNLPPSHLNSCNIIDLDYLLHVMVKLSPLHTDMSSAIPLTIGTIPLDGTPPPVPNPQSDASLYDLQNFERDSVSDSSSLAVIENETENDKLRLSQVKLPASPRKPITSLTF